MHSNKEDILWKNCPFENCFKLIKHVDKHVAVHKITKTDPEFKYLMNKSKINVHNKKILAKIDAMGVSEEPSVIFNKQDGLNCDSTLNNDLDSVTQDLKNNSPTCFNIINKLQGFEDWLKSLDVSLLQQTLHKNILTGQISTKQVTEMLPAIKLQLSKQFSIQQIRDRIYCFIRSKHK